MEDLIMKKLIMFLMLLAISIPALAVIEDGSPPVWGGTTPSANVVYQIDADEGMPTCYAYIPDIGEPVFAYFPEDATWDSVSGTLNINSEDLVFYVPAPGGSGANLTVRAQLASNEQPSEIGLELWTAPGGNFLGEIFPDVAEDPPGSGVWVLEGTHIAPPAGTDYLSVYIWAEDPITVTGLIIDVLRHDGGAPISGPGRSICVGGSRPIIIDPNVMTVYETDETEGDFTVRLRNEPPAGETITVTVDPNGAGNSWNEDIRLLGVDNPLDPNNTITLTFTDTTGGDPCDPCSWIPGNCGDWNPVTRTSCWNVPQTIIFNAIDDGIAEPPNLEESHDILVSSSWPGHESDANFVGDKNVGVTVVDNDQANILFELVGTGPIRGTPVSLYEYQLCNLWVAPTCYQWITYPQTIAVTLQVPPRNDSDPCEPGYVRIIVEQDDSSDNPPTMTPPLLPEHAHTPGDPNAIVFTSDGNPPPGGVYGAVRKWDVPFEIVLLANDDDELQIEEAFADGDQFYQSYVVFFVDETTDQRYTPETEPEGLERTVDINIEDNECGALGISHLDVSNPYYVMDEETLGGDPNDWIDDNGNPRPDCHVDIYDILEFATLWLNCSDPQDLACESYL
jgi:hypothetical protein